MVRLEAMVQSMTLEERLKPEVKQAQHDSKEDNRNNRDLRPPRSGRALFVRDPW